MNHSINLYDKINVIIDLVRDNDDPDGTKTAYNTQNLSIYNGRKGAQGNWNNHLHIMQKKTVYQELLCNDIMFMLWNSSNHTQQTYKNHLQIIVTALAHIAYIASVISQLMHSPGEHMDAVYQILRYLKSTPGRGLLFSKKKVQDIKGYTDSDWTGNQTDRRLTSGYFTFVEGKLVTWRSKK